MRKVFEIGGVVAAAVLIAFGITAIVMGFNGRSTINDSLKQEQITGTPDMTPAAIQGEVASAKAAQSKLISQLQAAGVKITPSPIKAPTCSVAGGWRTTRSSRAGLRMAGGSRTRRRATAARRGSGSG